jgi:ribosome-associated heat shock protein Hsp15
VTEATGSQRLDKWLWCARFFRTRTAASSFVEQASVRVTRAGRTHRVVKPAFSLRPGDLLAFLLSERPVIVRVLGLATRRGAARDAAALFETINTP